MWVMWYTVADRGLQGIFYTLRMKGYTEICSDSIQVLWPKKDSIKVLYRIISTVSLSNCIRTRFGWGRKKLWLTNFVNQLREVTGIQPSEYSAWLWSRTSVFKTWQCWFFNQAIQNSIPSKINSIFFFSNAITYDGCLKDFVQRTIWFYIVSPFSKSKNHLLVPCDTLSS